MRIFVDTSAVIAALDRRADEHGLVRAAIYALPTMDDLVTTTVTLTELVSLVHRRFGGPGLASLGSMLERLDIKELPRTLFDRALAETLAAGGQVSFVDRSSFLFMRAEGIGVALTLDEDFRTAGFETIP